MATFSEGVRSGLPRTPGGAPWPPSGTVAAAPAVAAVAAEAVAEVVAPVAMVVEATPAATAVPSESQPSVVEAAAPAVAAAASVSNAKIRSGLPRTPGGEPWPPAGTVAVSSGEPVSTSSAIADSAQRPDVAAVADSAPVVAAATAAVAPAASAAVGELVTEEVNVRQGLPRTVGGSPWPPAATATVSRRVAPEVTAPAAADVAVEKAASQVAEAAASASTPAEAAGAATVAATEATVAAAAEQTVPGTAAAAAGAATVAASAATVKAAAEAKAEKVKAPKEPAREYRGKTLAQWGKLIALWGTGAIVVAGILVLAARGITTLPGVPEFLAKYPGEYALPGFVEDGFPIWARWQHFFNFFLMALIVRSGLLVRQQTKPDAFYTPKKGGKKISIYLWMHTALDLLWIVNGIAFVVMLFISGHWARIVPTSWEVIPNALSAALQYATLEWPAEDGWHNFNSLQQIMYFTVVFIAAPLAIITGLRMSEWWPKDAEKLNKFYPAPLARAVHFPVMLFFVFFTVVHVFLVFATGMRKNLNHMFLGTPVESWGGFLWFLLALVVTVGAVWAARPLVLAPIAGAFGKVSER